MSVSDHDVLGESIGPGERWERLRREIDRILDEDRPKRTTADQRDWRQRAYDYARINLPEEDAIQRLSRGEVDRRESLATRRANRLLRDYFRGVQPLSWQLVGPLPIVVPRWTVVRDKQGEAVYDENGNKLLQRDGNERVRLDAATNADFESAADEEARVAKLDYDARLEWANGMKELARYARTQGYDVPAEMGDLRRRPLRVPDPPLNEALFDEEFDEGMGG